MYLQPKSETYLGNVNVKRDGVVQQWTNEQVASSISGAVIAYHVCRLQTPVHRASVAANDSELAN